jgi:sugar/nucleoside kinase (ribokinase family)
MHAVPAIEIERLVDTTGAGDLYAAGFLFGYTTGRSLADCARLGSLAAGIVIQQIGPRPRKNLREEAEKVGLL